ncbi:MAG TPA: methyl-accepting chemotaxis protein [Methylophilaceae bacterium]
MLKNISIKSRLIFLITVSSLLLIAVGVFGLHGMASSNESLRTVYEDRLVCLSQLSSIDFRLAQMNSLINNTLSDAIAQVGEKNVLSYKFNPAQVAKLQDQSKSAIDANTKLWTAYTSTYLTPDEKVLADDFAAKRAQYLNEGLQPVVSAIAAGNHAEAIRITNEKLMPLYTEASTAIEKLKQLQIDVAKSEHDKAVSNYGMVRNISTASIVIGVLLALGVGLLTLRAIINPLGRILGYFESIGKGNLKNDILVDSGDEMGKVLGALKTVQDNLQDAKVKAYDYQGQIEAIGKSQGVIEFNLDGTVITANPAFLAVINYTLDEAKGKHHSTFVDPAHAASAEYRAFWEKLNRGEFDAGEYKRIAKGGKEIWIQASYNPIRDPDGKPYKVVKYATEITENKLRNANYQGQLEAIGKSMGTIELNLDGTVITANDIFLNLLGYTLDEARGKHHSTFVDPAYGASEEYRAFWAKLNRGEFDNGEYKRVGKGGKEVWIQASYNPIRDLNGKPYKVVKYASDITTQKRYQMAVEDVLKETKNVMMALADGDLTHSMEGHFEGEFAILRDAVMQSMTNLRDIVQQITEAVSLIGSASKEIAAGNTDLSSRTEEQAASLEETASSMEELSSTVKQNAENAKQANQLAADASNVAVRGGEVVNDVVNTMSAINDSSRKIVDIISVIDGIAFQTNILALNAAVEAARAGEQGRGFAVVASEVRNLAQRSAAAAKEIKQLISDSVEKVEGGTKLVEEAGKTMEEIVTSVKRVTDIMGEIASASAEQSSGIDQVNVAITQMDEVTQQNAALVEQAAAAATSLEEQAQGLSESVSVFKLDNQAGDNLRRIASPPNVVVLAAPKAAPAEKPMAKKAPTKSVKRKGNSDDWEEF